MMNIFLASSLLFNYIQVPATNIYEEPSHRSELISQSQISEQVQLLDAVEDWYLIQSMQDNRKGWIHKKALIERSHPYASEEKGVVIKVTKPQAPAYNHYQDSQPSMLLPYESYLEVQSLTGTDYKWFEVILPSDQIAYIHQENISLSKEDISKEEMVELSKLFIGTPCIKNGRTSFGYDGPAFVQMLYRQMGIHIPLTLSEQLHWEGFQPVSLDKLTPGDLLFLGHNQEVEEVGLYLGHDEFLRASPSLDPAVIHTQKVPDVTLLSARTLHLNVFHDPIPYHHLSIDSSTKKEVLQPNESKEMSVVDHPTEKKANPLNSQKQIPSAKTEKNALLSEKITHEVGEFKYYFINADKTPLVISPINPDITLDSFKKWVELHRGGLKSLLSNHGAVLLRDFPVKNAQDFASIFQAILGQDLMDYKGGEEFRTKIAEQIYTTTETPSHLQIPLHHELSYSNSPPSYISFYCQNAPEKGTGQTILGRTENITRALKDTPEVWNFFKDQTLTYTSRHPPNGNFFTDINKTHKTWQDVFETEDRAEVERICNEKGYQYQWNNDWLEITRQAPAIKNPDQHFDYAYWFNQAHLYHSNPRSRGGWLNHILSSILYMKQSTKPYDISLENGEAIPRDIIYKVYDVLDQHTIKFDWKNQDVLLLDNIKMLHGRAPYKGQRRILVSMSQ